MNERRIVLSTCIGCGRCDGAHDFSCKGVAYHHEYASTEPQEGASRQPTDGTASASVAASGVPSCDSPDGSESAELAAWKAWANFTGAPPRDNASPRPVMRDLFRMVDELTLTNGIHRETQHHQAEHIDELRKELDDLRSKLAETEARVREMDHDLEFERQVRIPSVIAERDAEKERADELERRLTADDNRWLNERMRGS